MEITFVGAVLVLFVLLVMVNAFQFIERAVEALEKQAGIPSPPPRFTRRMHPPHHANQQQQHPPVYQTQ